MNGVLVERPLVARVEREDARVAVPVAKRRNELHEADERLVDGHRGELLLELGGSRVERLDVDLWVDRRQLLLQECHVVAERACDNGGDEGSEKADHRGLRRRASFTPAAHASSCSARSIP